MKLQNPFFFNDVLKANDGLQDSKQYLAAMGLIDQCSQEYVAPRVYHITIHDNAVGVIDDSWTTLCKKLKSLGIVHQWRSALEVDGDAGNHPGTHKHYFLILESFDRVIPHFLHPYQGGLFRPIQENYNVQFAIHSPQNLMHGGANFAKINKRKPEKIHDVKIWISYLYKNRSKPIPGTVSGPIYSRSRKPKKTPQVNPASRPVVTQNVKSTSLLPTVAKVFDIGSIDFPSFDFGNAAWYLVDKKLEPELSGFEKYKVKCEKQKTDRLEEFWAATTSLEDYEPPVESNSIEYLNHSTFGIPIDYAQHKKRIKGQK